MDINDIKIDDIVFVVDKIIPKDWKESWIDVMDDFINCGPFTVKSIDKENNRIRLIAEYSTIDFDTREPLDLSIEEFIKGYSFPVECLSNLPPKSGKPKIAVKI